jgi:GNAT superfamily N-acetyltransferase
VKKGIDEMESPKIFNSKLDMLRSILNTIDLTDKIVLDVLPEYQRQGVGKRLISELKKICRERNVSKMYVLTEESNTAAMNLYKSTGGKRIIPDSVVFLYKEEG